MRMTVAEIKPRLATNITILLLLIPLWCHYSL